MYKCYFSLKMKKKSDSIKYNFFKDDYDILNKQMNMPEEYKQFIKICEIEISDVYAVQIEDEWYRFQVTKIEEKDNVIGIFIDLGVEWCVHKNKVMFLPPKFLNVPSQVDYLLIIILNYYLLYFYIFRLLNVL